MIGCFPDPHQDELFYSICARYAARVRYPSPKLVLQELFGVRAMPALIDFPTNLDHFLGQLPPEHRYAVDQIIDEHTVLPFYEPFFPEERCQQIRAKMYRKVKGTAYNYAGVLGTRSKPTHLRSCKQCVVEDRKKFGETYWHRLHQIPGVEICPTHRLVLSESWEAEERSGLLSAEGAEKYPVSYEKEVYHFQKIFLRLASDISWLLNRCTISPGFDVLRQRYLVLLAERNSRAVVNFDWRDPSVDLLQRFQEYLPPEQFQFLHSSVQSTPNRWLPRLFQTLNAEHPLRHLLMMQFLGCTAEVFFSHLSPETPRLPGATLPEKPFGDGPWPCLNPASDHYGTLQIHEYRWEGRRFELRARPVIMGVFTCSCGYSYATFMPPNTPKPGYNPISIKVQYGPVWEAAYQQLMDSAISLEEKEGRLRKLLERPSMGELLALKFV